jgi:hypothetical protein
MDSEIQNKLEKQNAQIEQILTSVQKTEKYMRLTFWTTVVVVVLPFILMLIAIPMIVSSLSSSLAGLEGIL